MVPAMAYSAPARSLTLTFSNFVATSQRHLVSSLSQLQSTLAAKRKGDSCPQKGNTAKKRRGKSDTDDGAKYKADGLFSWTVILGTLYYSTAL